MRLFQRITVASAENDDLKVGSAAITNLAIDSRGHRRLRIREFFHLFDEPRVRPVEDDQVVIHVCTIAIGARTVYPKSS
jgi:hypothetical protein